jgi:23S rRNA (guanosine2251-2'-O)-methyltransferase
VRAAATADDAGRGRPRQGRRGLGGEQVEGRRAVRELLAAGRRPVRDVWLSDGLTEAPIVDEIVTLAERAGVAVRRVSRARLDAEARTESAQGVLAHARELGEATLDDLLRGGHGAPRPFLLVVDGVTDPHNLGALLRTAELAGASGVVLARHRAAHVTAAVTKAAAGAIEYLPIAVVPGIPAALSQLGAHGVWTVGLDAGAGASVFDLDLADQAVALVVGAEGPGLSRLTRARCDVLVAVPQRGRLASLNVAAATAVAAFEIARRRG